MKWKGRVWLNPPYSDVYPWLAKFQEHGNGIIIVNARCETGWFQRLVAGSHGMLLLKGRISFEPHKKHPPVGSVLIAYGEHNMLALERSGLPGVPLRRANQHITEM
jgi:hypothetical protein